jgi:hypothetical protein
LFPARYSLYSAESFDSQPDILYIWQKVLFPTFDLVTEPSDLVTGLPDLVTGLCDCLVLSPLLLKENSSFYNLKFRQWNKWLLGRVFKKLPVMGVV